MSRDQSLPPTSTHPSSSPNVGTILLGAAEIDSALAGMARTVVDSTDDVARLAIVGIRTGGVIVARRLLALIGELSGISASFGALDITLYRDDLYSGLEKLQVGPSEIPFSVDKQDILLVDDVLFTGRTVRAALDELMDLGRPLRVRLAVLLDRGHRELPIMASFVGSFVKTTREQRVLVKLCEAGRRSDDMVVLTKPPTFSSQVSG